MVSASARPIPAMTSTSDEKNNENVKQLISNNPDLRNSIYSFLSSTIVALEGQRPEDLKAKDVKIDGLQKQLLEALNYGNEKARKVEKLESELKLATETGLSQANALEDLQKKLQKQEEVEKNIRKGNLALHRELDPLKPENARLKNQLKDTEKEIRNLTERVDYQNQRLEIYGQKTRNTELKALQMETVLEKLERENHSLVLKGEQMSGRLLAVAEQWHEPNLARRKRQTSEMLDDGERAKRFSRMSR
jgi:chromosome segregation ATPase